MRFHGLTEGTPAAGFLSKKGETVPCGPALVVALSALEALDKATKKRKAALAEAARGVALRDRFF
eukprot:6423864-Lingulodinium_polyedra.AAC.1